jgi:predicted phosphodiesterase
VIKHGRPDFIVFSGDVVHDPDEDDVYLYVFDEFIDPVCQITGITSDKIVMCPGNHDVSRSSQKLGKLAYEGLLAHRGDVNYFATLYEKGVLQPYVRSVNSRFFEFCQYMGQPWDDPFFRIYRHGEVSFISMNTSFSCSLDGSSADRGKLFFPISAWHRALAAIPESHRFAVVNHFSVSEMDEPHSRVMQAELKRALVYFFGHVHSANPQVVVNPDGSGISLQAGALFERDDDFRGYSYSFLSEDNFVGVFRNYYRGRNAFDEATNVATKGIFFANQASQSYWQTRSLVYSPEQISAHLRNVCLPELSLNYDKAILDRKLFDTYVFPIFEEADLSSSGEDGDPNQILNSESEIQKLDDNICLHFPDETGATSFLHYTAIVSAQSPDKFSKARIPIYIDIRDKKGYEATVVQSLKAGMPSVDHAQFGWTARKSDQPFLVLVDNFSPDNEEHARWIRTAHATIPKARFIVCAKSPLAMQGAKSRPEIAMPFAYRSWTLTPFNRKQVRALVNKFDLPPALDKNLIVEEIRSKFRALGIPLSGPLIAIYLSILCEKKKYAPINAAAVIENFVELSLEKGAKSIIYQDDFDYNEQIDLLAFCAEQYAMKNIESFDFSELYDLVENYYKERGIRRNVSKIIEYFIAKGIFENVSNYVFIKYRIVFSYLLAKRIQNSSSFKSYVFTDLNFIQYVQELDIYFGINRQDEASLLLIAAEYASLEAHVATEFGPYVDAELAAKVVLPKSTELEEFMGEFADRVVENHQDEQRDDHVETEAEKPSQFVQRMKRDKDYDLLARWVKALAAYSVCIKNSESLSAELKEYHLARIMVGWGMLTSLAFKVIANLFDGGAVKIGPYEFNFGAHRVRDPRIVRLIIANVPRYVSHYANIYTSSGKLQEILKRVELNSFPEFLRVSMLVDQRSDGFLQTVIGYEKKNRANQTLTEAMLWKLRDSFLRYGLAKGYMHQFKQIIGEFTADVTGNKGNDRDRLVAQAIQRIGDQKLAKRISGND